MADPRFIQVGFDKTLSHFIEECGECLAAAGKAQRWGLSSVNPLLPVEQQETNEAWLWRELTDLREVMDRLKAELASAQGIGCNSEATSAPTVTFDSIWHQARENHAKYSATGSAEGDVRFHGLGLAGEAGEVLEAAIMVAMAAGKVANLVKKQWRDGGHGEELAKETADALAYNIMLADAQGMTPQDLLDMVAHKQRVFLAKMAERDRAGGGA